MSNLSPVLFSYIVILYSDSTFAWGHCPDGAAHRLHPSGSDSVSYHTAACACCSFPGRTQGPLPPSPFLSFPPFQYSSLFCLPQPPPFVTHIPSLSIAFSILPWFILSLSFFHNQKSLQILYALLLSLKTATDPIISFYKHLLLYHFISPVPNPGYSQGLVFSLASIS